MELVGGERKEIDAGGLYVDLKLAWSLNRVCVKGDAFAPANGRNFFNRKEDSRFVIGPHHRDNNCIGPDGHIEQVQVE